MTADLARSMWTLFEPVAGRAAPLGRTGPHQVHAAFQGFTFEMVARALPSVWDLIEPAEAWRIRTETSGAAVEESTDEIERDRLVAAAAALRALAEQLDPVGRPFFAAHLDLAWPDDLAGAGWASLPTSEIRAVTDVLATAASAIARRGWFAYPNPVGVEPPRR